MDPVATHRHESFYFYDEHKAQWTGPVSQDVLLDLQASGRLNNNTDVKTESMHRRGVMGGTMPLGDLELPRIEFAPKLDEFLAERMDRRLTVLSGPNNGGKSYTLKQLVLKLGPESYLLGCNRFSHIDYLSMNQRGTREHLQYFESFSNQLRTSRVNTESNEISLDRIVGGMDNKDRDLLFDVAGRLIGTEFKLAKSNPDNLLSPYYVDMAGQSLRYASSGTRLLLTLLGIMLDRRFKYLLMDEPEIGLSPKIQGVLGRFLSDPELFNTYCPHIKHLFVVTHSHLFLDRRRLANNFVVSKKLDTITLEPVSDVSALHNLQFSMLGNDLESLFLPSAIVIVEGPSDAAFFQKVFSLHVPDKHIAVVEALGDGKILDRLRVVEQSLGDLHKSPFADRLFVVLDQRFCASIAKIQSKGVKPDNVHVWTRNGVEYLYPAGIVANAFHCDAEDVPKINLESSTIEFNSIPLSKRDLAAAVIAQMTTDSPLHPELADFVEKVRRACG